MTDLPKVKLNTGEDAFAVALTARELPSMAWSITLFSLEEKKVLTHEQVLLIINTMGETLEKLIQGEDIPGMIEHKTEAEFKAAGAKVPANDNEPTTNEVLI